MTILARLRYARLLRRINRGLRIAPPTFRCRTELAPLLPCGREVSRLRWVLVGRCGQHGGTR